MPALPDRGTTLDGSVKANTDLLAGHQPIAIVGAACRLPGAPDMQAFAELLAAGVDAVTEIPDDRWSKAAWLHPDRGQRGKAYTFAAGVLGDVSGFDAGVLWHLAAGGRADGPAAAAAAGAGAGGAGGRGAGRGQARGVGGGRVCRRVRLGLHDAAHGRPVSDGRLLDDGGDAVFAVQPGQLCLRPAGAVVHGGHGVLLLPGGAASGVRGDPGRAGADGAGGRGEPAAGAAELRRVLRGVHAVAPRAVPCVRRAGGRLCAGRGRGGAGAEAAAGGAGGRRRGPCGGARDRRELGRADQRVLAAEPGGAVGAAAPGVWPLRHRSRGPGLRGGARHGHPGRRPDRGGGAGRGAGRAAVPAADHRVRQDQHRPPGGGERHGRAAEGGAGVPGRAGGAVAALRDAEPRDPVCRPEPATEPGGAGPGAAGPPGDDRGQQLRLRRHQRACRAGGSAGAGCRGRGAVPCRRPCPRPAAATAAVGAERGRVARPGDALARPAGGRGGRCRTDPRRGAGAGPVQASPGRHGRDGG